MSSINSGALWFQNAGEEEEKELNIHNSFGVPMYGVVMVISGLVKPEVELLVLASNSLGIDVCVDSVGLA